MRRLVLLYYDVFDSEEEAHDFANKQKGWDYINVMYLPYIEHDGNIYALWNETACYKKNVTKL